MWEFIKDNWVALLFGVIGLAEIIVRLTPSNKDNSVLNLVKIIIDFLIPNFKSKGGRY